MVKGQIIFSKNISNDFIRYCKKNNKQHIIFICDEKTNEFCLTYFNSPSQVIVIPDGELTKNIDTYSLIIKQLILFKINKSSLIVNLGGGVVSDIGGFVASTYMRGIDYVNIPTTLIGMVDAGIGGKTGIDFLSNKNFLGTFSLPDLILIDQVFLKTLPSEEILGGSAEMIKTGIIANDLLFKKLLSKKPLESLIQMTAETKQKIVKKDFYDKGERQLLNFGHTIGHALESYRLKAKSPIHHGFAIAKGMIAESRIAFYLKLINKKQLNEIIRCITFYTHQTELTEIEFEAIKSFLFLDKKNIDKDIIFSLPTGIGVGRTKIAVNLKVIHSSLFNV